MKTYSPHKHSELIKKWADGAQIQYFCKSGGWYDTSDPSWHKDAEYRLKPDIKPIYPEVEVGGFYANCDASFANGVLREFISSGDLARYVEAYGVDGLKGQ